jgi:hypothetical protein
MSRDSAAPAAGATAPTENDKSNGGIFTLFNEEGDSYSDDYEYMEQDDPDKKAIELDTPTSRILHGIQFITRGRGIPFKTLIVVACWSAFVVGMTKLSSETWAKNNGTCRWWCSPLTIDSTAAGYVGFALFLLLGFRVSDAYARYMEGIALWNDSISGEIRAVSDRHGLMHVSYCIPPYCMLFSN